MPLSLSYPEFWLLGYGTFTLFNSRFCIFDVLVLSFWGSLILVLDFSKLYSLKASLFLSCVLSLFIDSTLLLTRIISLFSFSIWAFELLMVFSSFTESFLFVPKIHESKIVQKIQ